MDVVCLLTANLRFLNKILMAKIYPFSKTSGKVNWFWLK